jgi:cellulose synthase/poly-beta-1,6-N-acetylglucosamine synthase-like glycosyltransferase
VILLSYILIFILLLSVLVDIVLILIWLFFFKPIANDTQKEPFISILVAARNEADKIETCLSSLVVQQYPVDKLEILVGDDASTDDTFQIVKAWSGKYNQIRLYSINQHTGKTKGKANVLAQLAEKAKGELFLFTDADIELPAQWARSMVNNFKPANGIVTGITGIKGAGLWARLQNVDWLFMLGMVKAIADLGKPVTAMGNNMLISRAAYNEVGGYEGIPFSVTEDLELFKQVAKKGYQPANLLDEKVLAMSYPISGWAGYFQQRKRWLKGGVQIPFYLVLVLILETMFLLPAIALWVLEGQLAIVLLVAKLCFQYLLISLVLAKLNQVKDVLILPFYTVYLSLVAVSLWVYYWLPVSVKWKGRDYA